jgi:hypothetical protein
MPGVFKEGIRHGLLTRFAQRANARAQVAYHRFPIPAHQGRSIHGDGEIVNEHRRHAVDFEQFGGER